MKPCSCGRRLTRRSLSFQLKICSGVGTSVGEGAGGTRPSPTPERILQKRVHRIFVFFYSLQVKSVATWACSWAAASSLSANFSTLLSAFVSPDVADSAHNRELKHRRFWFRDANRKSSFRHCNQCACVDVLTRSHGREKRLFSFRVVPCEKISFWNGDFRLASLNQKRLCFSV